MAAQTETVKFLPIQLIEGYGPFNPGFSSIDNSSRDSPLWAKTYSDVKGIPVHWSKTEVCHIWLNTHQFVYQHVLAGNISQLDYKELQEGWNWLPDTTKLSKTPIKCYVYVIKGFDETTQKWSVLVDANNNLDFRDETTIYPERINKDPHHYKQATSIQYEVYQKGQVRIAEIPIVFKMAESKLLYNFPQHASVTLKKGNKEYKLLVSSGFTTPDFETTGLVDPSTPLSAQKVVARDLIKINDIVEIDQVSYRNKGVDVYNNWLELEPVKSSGKPYSLQVGYPFRPFSAKAFNSGQLIDISQYRGQYVYVDFWATWCKGCVADMPALKKLYQKVDKKQVVFIGVAKDSPERLVEFLAKQPLSWPQIISDNTNNLVETYHISGLPISLLIDPKGIIIGRNLRPHELDLVLKNRIGQ
ncbi:TlpA disulfide reductase family protein (plasmid) [Fibrella sp. ES10-3-2-2]